MAALTAVMIGATAGCAPLSVTFTLGAKQKPLSETVVLSDTGAPEDKVALIDVSGVIVDGPRPGLLTSGTNPVDDLASRLTRAKDDPAVRAVVVRINSPGGSVTGSDMMYGEVRRFARETGKPVVASLGEVAASGGYYVALAGDRIVAQPTTITGSVGVIFPTFNVSEGMTMIGLRSRAVTSGPNKDLASPFAPMREEHYAILQSLVDEYYARFRGLVVERRPGLSAERLDEATDGRIMSGARAVALGLADAEGGVREAFEEAKALAGVRSARLVKYHQAGSKPRSMYAISGAAEAGTREAGRTEGEGLVEVRVDRPWGDVDGWAGAYYLWMPTVP